MIEFVLQQAVGACSCITSGSFAAMPSAEQVEEFRQSDAPVMVVVRIRPEFRGVDHG